MEKPVSARLWKLFGRIFLGLTLLMAVAYLGVQWIMFEEFKDSIFVGAMLANSVTVYRVALYLHGRISSSKQTCATLPEEKNLWVGTTELLNTVFESKLILLSGIMTGSIYVFAIWILAPWQIAELDILLAAFLFGVNFLHGMAFYSLAAFFTASQKRLKTLEVSIYNVSRPDISIYLDINRGIVITASLITCVAIVGLLLSVFRFDFAVMLFSALAFLIVVTAYYAPLHPLTALLRISKIEQLHKIEMLLNAKLVALTLSDVSSEMNKKLDEITALQTLRKSINSIKTFPPGGDFSFMTATSVTFLTVLPTLIEKLLAWMNV